MFCQDFFSTLQQDIKVIKSSICDGLYKNMTIFNINPFEIIYIIIRRIY